MTTREQLKRAVGGDRSDAGRGVAAEPGPTLPGAALRGARAQGRRPLSRRARHEDPCPLSRRTRARRLQGAARRGLHEGVPAQLRALSRSRPGRRPAPVAARARRSQGSRTGHRRAEADRCAAPGPDLLAEHRRRRPADGRRSWRSGPISASRSCASPSRRPSRSPSRRRPSSTSTTPPRRTRSRERRCPGATVSIATPGQDPLLVTASSTGAWAADVDLRRGRNQFDVSAVDPDTGKHSEETDPPVHHGPVPRHRGTDPDRSTSRPRARRSRTARSPSRVTSRTRPLSSSVPSTSVRPGRHRGTGGATPAPPPTPALGDGAGRRRRDVQHAARADDRTLDDHRHRRQPGGQDRRR